MKSTAILIVFLTLGFASNAQESGQVFIVFETQRHTVLKSENGKDVWRPEIPYKNSIRIILPPFTVKGDVYDNCVSQSMTNQLAEFIYKNHLKEFEHLVLHNAYFNYKVEKYTTKDYDRKINRTKTESPDPYYSQMEISVIEGFTFDAKPNCIRNEYQDKMVKFITQK